MTTAVRTDFAVLIVEDHLDTADMLRHYLRRRAIEADAVTSGADALEVLALARRKPRCLILDQSVPGMTGLELFQHLRDHPDYADLPVFFYSAALDPAIQARAMALGAKGWFIKGVDRLDDVMRGVIRCCSH